MSTHTRTRIALAATAAIACLTLGAQPANAEPAPEPHGQPVQACPRVDDLADQHRAAGFADPAANTFAQLIRRDCLAEL